MKLYMHPVSTTSRPVMQFIADNKIDIEQQVVDILKGEHYGDAYSKLNPNHLIPMLEDGDFRLTESATILRYLADKVGSPAYPKDTKKRARIDEMLDWLNSNLYRDWGYGLIYPQVFPHLKRDDPAVQAATVAWGKEKSKAWLQILNDHWIGPNRNYLCGNEISIADYFGAALVTAGELIHCNFSAYPNVERWLAAMKQRPSHAKVYEVFNGFVASTKGQPFLAI
ncbi:MAG TPA: glutathione S-transferase family protein [Candidatus Sulfotelmatobacter sp.]|nr:glutathione S-transferase family protein [Candidatus Sulfotelmatobacter sp.]